jgi:para-aminobenzoate synthetase component 1
LNLKDTLNHYGETRTPFFFCISFDLSSWEVVPINDIENDIFFSINSEKSTHNSINLEKEFVPYTIYEKQFNKVIENIKKGNTYLLNLTTQTQIKNKLNLEKIYKDSNAKYKLYYKNKFVSFSPETFIKISNNKIKTYPMKGTIDASIPNAKEKILNNKKELAEHIMIVDLLRNDLNMVSQNVRLEKFRYIDEISAGKKKLLQVSSKIVGDLDNTWHENIGNIILPLLPAGSISGTPKKKTIELIQEIESYDRGFFSGIWGVYNGNTLDTSILIRYIENDASSLVYKSGGGITLDSDCKAEYQEMKDKVYIP